MLLAFEEANLFIAAKNHYWISLIHAKVLQYLESCLISFMQTTSKLSWINPNFVQAGFTVDFSDHFLNDKMRTMKLNSNVYISVWQTLAECLWAAGVWQKVRNGFNLHSQPFEYFKSSLAFAKVQHAKFWNWRRLSNHFKKHFLFHIEGSDIGQKLFILNLEWFSVMCRVSHHEQSFSTHFLHSFFSQKESEKSVNIP